MAQRYGTSHFASVDSAVRYYAGQEHCSRKDALKLVDQKLMAREISIGRPPEREGWRHSIDPVEGRYFMVEDKRREEGCRVHDKFNRCHPECKGWDVFENNEYGFRIERCDECDVYEDDSAAAAAAMVYIRELEALVEEHGPAGELDNLKRAWLGVDSKGGALIEYEPADEATHAHPSLG